MLFRSIVPAVIPGVGSLLYGNVQFRIAEALCILPFFLPESVFGLFIGCTISNALGVAIGLTSPIDIAVGSLATLIAAGLTLFIKKEWLVPLPAVIVNAVVIGVMLARIMVPETNLLVAFPAYAGGVLLGQTVVCYGMGLPLLYVLKKRVFTMNKRNT